MALLDTIRAFAVHHIPWLILVIVGGIGIHSYMQEHDSRLLAEQKIAVDEQQVKTLQASIAVNNQAIVTLQNQMQQRDAQNAQVIAQLAKQRQQAVTPTQQVQVLATEAKLPEPIVSIPGTQDWRLPSADVQPLFSAVSDGAMATANLTTCQADLKDQKDISATKDKTITADVAIIATKDDEIKTLKKPRSFWHRMVGNVKQVIVSAAIGYFLGGHKF